MPDHVHLLVEVPPAIALSGLVQRLKGHSWRLLRQEFPHLRRLGALWSPSWLVSTVGGAPSRWSVAMSRTRSVPPDGPPLPSHPRVSPTGDWRATVRTPLRVEPRLEQANYWRPDGARPRARPSASDSWLRLVGAAGWGDGSSSVQQQALGTSTVLFRTGGVVATAAPGGARPGSTRGSVRGDVTLSA